MQATDLYLRQTSGKLMPTQNEHGERRAFLERILTEDTDTVQLLADGPEGLKQEALRSCDAGMRLGTLQLRARSRERAAQQRISEAEAYRQLLHERDAHSYGGYYGHYMIMHDAIYNRLLHNPALKRAWAEERELHCFNIAVRVSEDYMHHLQMLADVDVSDKN